MLPSCEGKLRLPGPLQCRPAVDRFLSIFLRAPWCLACPWHVFSGSIDLEQPVWIQLRPGSQGQGSEAG